MAKEEQNKRLPHACDFLDVDWDHGCHQSCCNPGKEPCPLTVNCFNVKAKQSLAPEPLSVLADRKGYKVLNLIMESDERHERKCFYSWNEARQYLDSLPNKEAK